MGFFNRNKTTQTTLPAELSEYYQAERREKKGLAWLLALFTLLVTAALVIALFIGGRWLYRKVRNEKVVTTPTASVEPQTDSNNTNSTSSSDPVPVPEDQASSQPEVSTPGDDQATTDDSNNESPATTTQTIDQNQQSTSDNSAQTLVNTGPSDILPVFIMIVIAGYLLSFTKLKFRKG